VQKPRKPAKPRKPSIPSGVLSTSRQQGGAFFGELIPSTSRRTLPPASRPKVASTPTEIKERAKSAQRANQRRSSANNVRGYVTPTPIAGTRRMDVLPTAEELLAQTEADQIPTAEDLLHLTSEQLGPSEAIDEGSYRFPQVSPTKTSNPPRPRTLESGWERISDENDPSYPGILRVRFRDGQAWEYYNVPSDVWQRFKRVQSPGRFINRVLNNFDYGPGAF